MKIKMKWPVREQADLLKKLGDMMQSGYMILDALSMLKLQLNERRRADLTFAMEKLTEGCPVFQVLEMISFHKDAVTIVYFAEQHGNLPFAFRQSGEPASPQDRSKRKIKESRQIPLVFSFNGLRHHLYYEISNSSAIFRHL